MRWLDGITDLMEHEFEQAPGVGDGQGGLECYSPCKELDTTKWLNWTFLNQVLLVLFSLALRGVTGNGQDTALLYSLPLNHTNLRLHMGSQQLGNTTKIPFSENSRLRAVMGPWWVQVKGQLMESLGLFKLTSLCWDLLHAFPWKWVDFIQTKIGFSVLVYSSSICSESMCIYFYINRYEICSYCVSIIPPSLCLDIRI